MLISICVPVIINYKPKAKKEETTILVSKKDGNEKEKNEVEELLKVDIKGEVINPGIYELSSSSRVIDVIEKAGGLTQNANTTVINLSKKITDEMVIIIYNNTQVEDFQKTKELEQQLQEKCIQAEENALKNDACITESTSTTSKVSINTATIEELQTLPGIGQAKAQDIIDYRNENGPFNSIEDLTKVSGIGESVFAKIKDYITI